MHGGSGIGLRDREIHRTVVPQLGEAIDEPAFGVQDRRIGGAITLWANLAEA